ncbi:MAG TPA: penicillin-binding transpeptidase domain-containing protein [Turneriella sp.]|nr:penicillin-binding transpeptidase domain-containing protein [Turneriella sp.]
MRKIKATVNLFLVFPFALFAVEKKSAYLMAERSDTHYEIISSKNTQLIAPMGSLLKPFAAWYLLERGIDSEQVIYCPPRRKQTKSLRCWIDTGHGAMTLKTALAQSCNYYFLSRFLGLNLVEYETWLQNKFDWPITLKITKPENVYGFDLTGGMDVKKILSMYTKLLNASDEGNPHAETIMDGLSQTCQGTLQDFCSAIAKNRSVRFIAGKTGTIIDAGKNYGIAFLYLEYLPLKQKIILLCYEKNKMGSQAALNAVTILNGYRRKK